jgi:hypothetical protein
MLPNLNHLLEYKNISILQRYSKDYPNNKLSAEEALSELLKYFWLCQKHSGDKKISSADNLDFICAIHPEMREIDEMWHTFLLFTKEYQQFGEKYFGCFLHHIPNTEDDKPKLDDFEIKLERYLSYVYDNLGEATLKKWFADYFNEGE